MEEITQIPFYLNWTFWTVVISAIAVLLSQLPPIKLWFKKAKIEFELYSMVSLTQKVGNPNILMHVYVTNTGGRKIRLKNIVATVERNAEQVAVIPVNGYLKEITDNNETLFTGFSLQPNADLSHAFVMYKKFKREDESKYRKIEANLRSDLLDKNEQRLIEGDIGRGLIELDTIEVEKAQNFFDKNFIWSPGEYEITIKLECDQESASIEKKYSFVLFESQCIEFQVAREDLKYGSGLWWQKDSKIPSARVDIKEIRS